MKYDEKYDEIRTVISPDYIPTFHICAFHAEAKGQVQRMGSQAMHGLERLLLEHVVANAEPGNPDSVLAAMDAFWNKTFQAQGEVTCSIASSYSCSVGVAQSIPVFPCQILTPSTRKTNTFNQAELLSYPRVSPRPRVSDESRG